MIKKIKYPPGDQRVLRRYVVKAHKEVEKEITQMNYHISRWRMILKAKRLLSCYGYTNTKILSHI